MIPFISLANAILVSLYGWLRPWNRWLGLGLAALAKTLFLTGRMWVLMARPLHLEMGGKNQPVVMPDAFLSMMGWPQLATAIAGGLLAFGIQCLVTRKRSGY